MSHNNIGVTYIRSELLCASARGNMLIRLFLNTQQPVMMHFALWDRAPVDRSIDRSERVFEMANIYRAPREARFFRRLRLTLCTSRDRLG